MRLLIVLLLASAVFSQPLILVNGPGANVTGTMHIVRVNLDATTTAILSQRITAGNFNPVSIRANTLVLAGTVYRVIYNNALNETIVTETWTVPASPTTTTRAAIFSAGTGGTGVISWNGLAGNLVPNPSTVNNSLLTPTWAPGDVRLNFPLASGNPSATLAGITGPEYATIKADIASSLSQIGTLNSSFSTLNTTVSSLNTTVSGHTTSIATLNSTVTSQGTSISSLTSSLSSLTGTVATKAIPGPACPAGQHISQISATLVPTCTADTGSGGGLDTGLKLTRVSSTVLRLERGFWTIGGTSWFVESHDCTISGGTSTGPWRADTAENGNVVITVPTGLTWNCAVTAGQTLGLDERFVVTSNVDPGTRVTPLANGTVSGGLIDTTINDVRTAIHGQSLNGTDGVDVSTVGGVTTIRRNPAVLASLVEPAAILSNWDFRLSPRTTPNRNGAGAPSGGSCTSTNVSATYDDTSVGGASYVCRQTSTGVYGWVAVGAGSSAYTITSYTDGFVYFPFNNPQISNADAAGAIAPTLTTPYYYWGFLSTGITMTTLALEFNSLTLAGSNGMAVGIYDKNCNKLAQSAKVVSNAGASEQLFTFSPALTLAPGPYFVGIASENTNIFFRVQQFGNAIGSARQNDNGALTQRYFYGDNVATGTGASIVMPATCATTTRTGLTTNGVPHTVLYP